MKYTIIRNVSLAAAIALAAVSLTACANAPANTGSSADTAQTSASGLSIQNQKAVDSPEWFKKLDAAKDCDQLIVVAGVGETTCYVSMHEKDADGNWKMLLQTPGYVGLEGM